MANQNNLDIIFTNGICIVKDKLGRVMLKGTDIAGLFEVNRVNKVSTQRNKNEVVSTFNYVMSLYASLCDLASSKHLVIQSNVKSEPILENVKQIDIIHRNLGYLNKQVLMKLISSCNQFKRTNKECSTSFYSVCMHGKRHKLHYSCTPDKTTKSLELVHTNLWNLRL